MGLELECSEVYSVYELLNNKGLELIPLVLSNFNDYVVREINPSLPTGFSLSKSEHAFYNKGKFIVYSGRCKTSNIEVYSPSEVEQHILKLLGTYKENTAWIEQILNNLQLNRK